MNQNALRGVLPLVAAAALLSSCVSAPPAGPPAEPARLDAAGDPVVDATGRPVAFRLLAAQVLVPTGVAASSVENALHPAALAVDGRTTTAWAPRWDDAAPALTFAFGAGAAPSAFSIRASPAGLKVAVAYWDGGAWTTVRSGLAPSPSLTTRFPLPPLPTTQVRLGFTGAKASDVLVCEVGFEGEAAACPTPTR